MSDTKTLLDRFAATLELEDNTPSVITGAPSISTAGAAFDSALANTAGDTAPVLAPLAIASAFAIGEVVKSIVERSVNEALIHAKAEMQKEEHRRKEKMAVLNKGIKCGESDCNAIFEISEDLAKHCQTHHMGVMCQYEGCGAIFKSGDECSRHFTNAHCGTMLKCDMCKAYFENPKDLCQHVLEAHAGNRNNELKMSKIEAITCCVEGCGASFEDSVKLVTHFQECHRD